MCKKKYYILFDLDRERYYTGDSTHLWDRRPDYAICFNSIEGVEHYLYNLKDCHPCAYEYFIEHEVMVEVKHVYQF